MRRQQVRTLLPAILTATVLAAGALVARWRWSKHAPLEPSTERLSTGADVPHWLSSRLDLQDPPADRLDHFDWLEHTPTKVRIVGWQTWLVSESDVPGGRVAKIGVRPELRGDGVPFSPDTFCEAYEYRQGKIRYLGGQSLSNRRFLFVD